MALERFNKKDIVEINMNETKTNIRVEYSDNYSTLSTTYVNIRWYEMTAQFLIICTDGEQTVYTPISRILSITITEKE